ncbi:MAG: hypothetical protein RIB98_08140 [Acidimicrobiales bacterium]
MVSGGLSRGELDLTVLTVDEATTDAICAMGYDTTLTTIMRPIG